MELANCSGKPDSLGVTLRWTKILWGRGGVVILLVASCYGYVGHSSIDLNSGKEQMEKRTKVLMISKDQISWLPPLLTHKGPVA